MKRFYTLLYVLFLASSVLFADETKNSPLKDNHLQVKPKTDANLVGHVQDALTGEHLPFIGVAVKGTTIGTVTDATGHYMLKDLPAGEITIVVSSLGYKTLETKVTTQSNTVLEANFLLEEDIQLLNEVVISTSFNETNKQFAPLIVNVLSGKLFETTASCNLTEAMSFQPGLRIENNCGNCGTTQLRINGLEGQYSQILLDSRPIFSSLAGVYGLEQLPVGMVERVEVVRGGGSALYGSSAIGGVVNIITKEPLRNSLTLSNTTNIFEDGTTDVNTALNASFVTDDHKAGVYIFGMMRDRGGYDHNDDGFSELPKINSETIGFRGYYRTSHTSRLTAEYHHIHEFRRGGDAFDKPPHEAEITEQLDHKIDGGGLRFNLFSPDYKHRWEVFTSAQLIRRDSYYGVKATPDAYGNTDDKTFVAGTQYIYTMDRLLFLPAELTGGLEYNYNNLHDRFLGLNRDFKQRTSVFGGYLQNEWKNERLSISVGARLDKHNLMDAPTLSPRANIRFSPTQKLGFRASYSKGYRAPQAYDEDLHVEAAAGSLAIIELAEDLKPEHSHSVSASVDFYHNFGNLQTNILVEPFFTKLNDVFALEKTGESEDGSLIYWERRNANGATVKGVNLEGKAGLPNVFELQLGYTIQSSRYNDPESWSDELTPQRKMFRSPGNYGYFTLSSNIVKKLKASIFGNYTGSMLVKHTFNDGETEADLEKTTPSFWDLGVQLAYEIKLSPATSLELSGGVKNIFNAYQKDLDYGALKDASYVYGPTSPRVFFAGVKVSL